MIGWIGMALIKVPSLAEDNAALFLSLLCLFLGFGQKECYANTLDALMQCQDII